MSHIDLTSFLEKKFARWPRVYGRYSASELYNIYHDKITPEEWIAGKQFTTADMIAMWRGSVVHDMVQSLLTGGTVEAKVVKPYLTFTIVGKADFVPGFEDSVWEFKTSPDKFDLTESERFQGRVYCTLFERSKTMFYQPVVTPEKLLLETLGEETRDDEWFSGVMSKVLVFHAKLEPVWKHYQAEMEGKQIAI